MTDAAPAARPDPAGTGLRDLHVGVDRPCRRASAVAHGSLANLVAVSGRRSGVDAGVGVLQFASFSFDASVLGAGRDAGARRLPWWSPTRRGDGAAAARRSWPARGDGERGAVAAGGCWRPGRPADRRDVAWSAPRRCSRSAGRGRGPRGRRLVNTYGPTETTVMVATGERRPGRTGAGADRLGRSPTPRLLRAGRAPAAGAGRAWPASCTSPARVWPAAMSAGRG